MFNTTHHQVINQDMAIAEKKIYENRIDRLSAEVRRGCTPDQLLHAGNIADDFRSSLVFKYISVENSIVDFAVWESESMQGHATTISFKLNGHEITSNLADTQRIVLGTSSPADMIDLIKKAVSEAIAKELMPLIIPEIANKSS